MRRYIPLLIAGAAFIVAACSDAIAPKRSVGESELGGPAAFALTATSTKTKSVEFTLDPAGGRVRVGDYFLDYPANAVCDPAKSSYGPGTWNDPCETLQVPISITATYWWEGKTSYVEFSPDIRFSPDKQVFLSTIRPAIKGKKLTDAEAQQLTIWFWKVIDGTRYFVDEAAADPSLQTIIDTKNGKVSRQIRHFSGYNVHTGAPCDDTVGDPDCISDAGGELLDELLFQ